MQHFSNTKIAVTFKGFRRTAERRLPAPTHKFVDLDLLVHFGGKERTKVEYEKLLKYANFKMERINPVKDSFFSIIEATPR